MPERADELKHAVALAVLGFVSATGASIAQEVVSPEDYVRSAEGAMVPLSVTKSPRVIVTTVAGSLVVCMVSSSSVGG